MNVAALRRGVSRVARAVEQLNVFNMAIWAEDAKRWVGEEPEVCGTACCFAGYVVPVKSMRKYIKESNDPRLFFSPRVDIQEEARIILDLTSDQSQKLFSTLMWPEEYKIQYSEGQRKVNSSGAEVCTPKRLEGERMKVAALRGRVETFIMSEGRI